MKLLGCLHPIQLGAKATLPYRLVPCGKCPNCRARTRYELSIRIYLETLFAGSSFFITLTYDDDNLKRAPTGEMLFDKKQVRYFFKWLRRSMKDNRIRYFFTCECGSDQDIAYYQAKYGLTCGRSHYHAIILTEKETSLFDMRSNVERAWPYGRIQCDRANMATIQYSTMYALKDEQIYNNTYENGDPRKPFRLFSSRPGLSMGFPQVDLEYLEDTGEVRYKPSRLAEWLKEYISNDGEIRSKIRINGKYVSIPRYIRDKLPELVSEDLAGIGLRNLDAHQEDMAMRREQLSYYDCFGERHNNYQIDNQILQERIGIRKLRKKSLKKFSYGDSNN